MTVKSSRDATTSTFSGVSGESFVAELNSPHFFGRVVVSTYLSGPPSLLFDEMAREWKGWDRKKTWAALDEELCIEATSDHTGHTALLVTMRDSSDPADWNLRATLELEAGQLEQVAKSVRYLFKNIQGSGGIPNAGGMMRAPERRKTSPENGKTLQ